MKGLPSIKKCICLVIVVTILMVLNDLTVAGNRATQTLLVSVQVVDNGSIRAIQGEGEVSTLALDEGTKFTKDSSIPYAITVSGTKDVTIGAKIESSTPTGTALYVGSESPTVGMKKGNVLLSASEQDVTEVVKKTEDAKALTYSFDYVLDAPSNTGEEKRLTSPVTVILTVSY